MTTELTDRKEIREKIQQAVDEVNKAGHTQYVLGEYIGEGGFTYTYELKNYSGEGEYVLKVTPWKGYEREMWEQIVERKKAEVELLSSANGQFVSRIFDVHYCFGDDDLPECILTIERKLLPCDAYFKAVGEQIPMSNEYHITKLLKELAQGLRYIHVDMDTMHRDIKDQNLAYNPVTNRLSYIDFSISKGECHSVESITMVPAASYLFSAPEYYFSLRSDYALEKKEHYTHEMDMYSLGAVMFYFITGEYTVTHDEATGAYYEKSMDEKQQILKKSNASLLVQRIILCMIDEDPEDRYHTAQELLDDIMCLYDLTERNKTLKVKTDKLTEDYDSQVRSDKEQIKAARRRAQKLEDEHANMSNRISRQDKQIESLKDQRWNGIISSLAWLIVPAINVICLYIVTSLVITPLPGSGVIETIFDTWESQYAVWICMWVTMLISIMLFTYVTGRSMFMALVVAGTIAVAGCMYPTAMGGIGMIEKYEFSGELFVKDGYEIQPEVTPAIFEHASHETDYSSYDYRVVNDRIIVNDDAKDKAFAIGWVRFTNNSGSWCSSGFIVDNTSNVKPQKIDVYDGSIMTNTNKVEKNSTAQVVCGKIGADGLRIKKRQHINVEVYAVSTSGESYFIHSERVVTNRKGAFIIQFYEKLRNVDHLQVRVESPFLDSIKTADFWVEALCGDENE